MTIDAKTASIAQIIDKMVCEFQPTTDARGVAEAVMAELARIDAGGNVFIADCKFDGTPPHEIKFVR